ATNKPDNQIRLTRTYDAPLEAVWDAWTVPGEVERWWGPRGFTLTTHSRDLRSGGHWHYTMHGPDGTDYENTTQYLEVEPRRRLVYDHGGHLDRPPLFRMTVQFTEQDGRTRLDLSMALATPEIAAQTREFIRKAGGEATWDRLAEHLGHRHGGKDLFVIARSFEAAVERIYDLWTDPVHLAQWLPPQGATMRFLRTETRVGGTNLFEMTGADGGVIHGLIRFLQLERPTLIAYTQQFCDASGRVTRAPFFPHWPETMLTQVELIPETPGRTRVQLRWEPAPEAATEDVAEFLRQRGSMTAGWTGSFDKLEALLVNPERQPVAAQGN